MNSDQSFFQVVWSSEKLEIPPEFVLRMGGSLAKSCILRDGAENVWPVEVAARGDEWCFRNGWTKFYREKSLENGDILVFHYRGSDLFDFTLYGSNACGKGEESSVSQQEECDDDEDQENTTFEAETKNKDQENTTFEAETKNKNQNVPDCYGAEIFNSGLDSRPDNPYFVSRSRTLARKNMLYIPKNVIKDNHLSIPKKLFLADERGRKWRAEIKQWKDGRLWCIRGWGSLCRVNRIECDDTCICEFVQEEGCKDMCIRVRVVSADN